MVRFIGIDPGLYGAIVSLDAYGLIRYQSLTPIIQKVEGSKGKSEYNLHAMRDALLAAKAEDDSELPAQVIIEQVNAMPHDGVASSFRFGMGFGIWRGLVAALELPIQLVRPMEWQKEMLRGRPRGKATKTSATAAALDLWPDIEIRRKKDHGLADAALIAEYGRRNWRQWNGE